jgi:hypothetical protein
MKMLAIAAFTLLLFGRSEAPAQELSQAQSAILLSRMQVGMGLPAYITAGSEMFRALDIDMDGRVTLADKERQEEEWPKAIWRPRLEEILRHDLNFDGVITRDEVFAYETHNAKHLEYTIGLRAADNAAVDRAVKIMLADCNGDGKIEWNEIITHVKELPVVPVSQGNAMWRVMDAILSLAGSDPSGLSKDGFENALRTVFDGTDSNKDGLVSQEEIDESRFKAGLAPAGRRH